MDIALLGYGKMGKMIAKLAKDKGYNIAVVIDAGDSMDQLTTQKIDVAIDFSTPNAAFNNISFCIENGIPVVSGTTGWLERYDEVVTHCQEKGGAFIYASNFSLGVNIFFDINSKLAAIMGQQPQYDIEIEEIHHTQKLDAPSGTAITLAKGVLEHTSHQEWTLGKANQDQLPISSVREGNVPGTHTVHYDSVEDSISIKHIAKGREGFALGAIVAAKWLIGKKGVYTMKDVLNIV